MLALEAMTFLIAETDKRMAITRQMAEIAEQTTEEREWCEQIEVAVSISTAMLNTALPIARYRAFVGVDAEGKGKKIQNEYTICSPTIAGILAGLIGLLEHRTDVHVTLWEQRPEGADMLSGYQGPSKVARYKSWLSSLPGLEVKAPVQ